MDEKHPDDREINESIEEFQKSHKEPDLSFNVPLKIPPRHGVYLWWPGPVESWVHPEDYDIANELIPSNRVFRREQLDNEYSVLTYGDQQLRVRPVIWLEIRSDGYEIGDQVEVKSRMGRGRPFIAHIVQIRWDQENRRILYSLEHAGRKLVRPYTEDEFQLAPCLDAHLDQRKLKLLAKSRMR